MSKNLTTRTTIENLAAQLKTTFAKKNELSALQNKVNELVTAGGEPNVIEGVKVNGVLLSLADKIADILIAEGTANGTLAVAGVDVAVKGLAALAYKAEVSEGDLSAALKAVIDAKAKQADLDVLTGTGEGSISKMIDDAFNDFSTKVTDDGVINSYKELIDWAAEHGAEATELAGGIAANTTAINGLKTLVGTLPEGATSTTVVGYIAEAIAALSIGDYAKTTEVTAAISAALASYYTKTETDAAIAAALAGYLTEDDIQDYTAEEIAALLADAAE